MLEREQTRISESVIENLHGNTPRTVYVRPSVISYTDEDILSVLGPAQTGTGCMVDEQSGLITGCNYP